MRLPHEITFHVGELLGLPDAEARARGFDSGCDSGGQLYLTCKPVGRRQVGVTAHKHAADNQHGAVWRSYLRDAARHLSLPARPRNEVVARLGARGSFADIGEVRVVRRIPRT